MADKHDNKVVLVVCLIIMTWMWIVCSDWFRSIVYYAAFLPALNTAPKRWCTEKYSTVDHCATY